ncbi:MAG TPA: hypothetical protein VFU27_02175, partial [Terriglobales bacterium]|nr:hypothetical protein [Terriglobales bacterium]
MGILVAALCAAALAAILVWVRIPKPQPVTLKGAVIRREEDPNKEQPVADAQIIGSGGMATGTAMSDAAGYFTVTLRPGVKPGEPILLSFAHTGYRPLIL